MRALFHLEILQTVALKGLRWAVMRAIFNVSLIVRDPVTRQCPQTTTFEERGELK